MGASEISIAQCRHYKGRAVCLKGHVHALRRFGNLAFVVLRDPTGTIQAVIESPELLAEIQQLHLETPVKLAGTLRVHKDGQEKLELQTEHLSVLSLPEGILPVEINKENKLENLSLATMLDYRPLTLRSPKVRAIFKIEAVICAAFREFLTMEGFTEIHSPKIVLTGTEGGAQLFMFDYFGRPAYLAQSPQFYKQIMVGVFERVFEIGAVYRAEEHETSRHMNEYVSMDFEMGFIDSEMDVIAMQVRLLQHVFDALRETCSAELAMYGATIPTVGSIPQVTLSEAMRILSERVGWRNECAGADLDPEGERLLCQYFLTEEGTDLVYVTGYPRAARPFYAMPLGETGLTHSFDLIFRGLEITTGGQRIHDYKQLSESMQVRGLDPIAFADYLQCFRYGMPPHGGLAIGLERLTKQLLGLPNVKLASLFPRDRNRVTP